MLTMVYFYCEVIKLNELLISIDGGGTRTEVCIFDPQTKRLALKNYEGLNINQIGKIRFDYVLETLFKDISFSGNIRFCIGMPGYGESSDTDKLIESSIRSHISDNTFYICNDVELAHLASFGLNDGILLLSGTGSMLFSIDNGKKYRLGGWGHLLGDEGSSFYIGLKALNHVSHVFDNNGNRSKLSNLICNEFNFDFPSKLINYIYSSNNYRKDVAKISILVDKAAQLGCPVAKGILIDSARYFVEKIGQFEGISRSNISYAGGTFNSNILRSYIEQFGNFTFIQPKLKPVMGGILRLLSEYSEDNMKYTIEDLSKIYENTNDGIND